jgi:1-acyl-sn-glycerol-3-phosphate acyltransferase
MIRTIVVVIVFVLLIFLVMPWLILWSWLTGSQDLMYRASMGAVAVMLRAVGVRVQVEGVENIPAGTCIFAANHTSYIDPLAFAPHIPRRVSLLLKKELFRMPILGFGMRMAKFVVVDRETRQGAANSLKDSLRYLSEGLSLALYPEGTRSPDGRLLPFKRGAFVMALQAGVPIVPVSIAGGRELMPKGTWAIHPGEVTIRFGTPIDSSGYTPATLRDLLNRVHDAVAAGLPPEQQPLPQDAEAPTAASA